MNFNSWQFLIFLPIVVALYWLLPSRFRWIMLLIASYIFYMCWNVWLIFLITFTTAVSYVSGLVMEKYGDRLAIKRACLIITLVACLGVLFFFKYFTFAVNLVIDLINLGAAEIPEFAFSLILPVGISFYTFQTLSYVIDIYRGRIKAERHLGYYALFVTYFPQLVAGPIERPENLIPQLRQERSFNMDDLAVGLRISVIGFFKKVVIADGVAVFVNAVYNDVASANGLTVLIATVLFAIQIYCDFSGYTDIAIGVARMMGIKLKDNFNQPYLATSIKDFWRRWHISLTSWFTDYVYIPLGGSRCKVWRWAINVLIVFLLSGLWHGAALTFVIWGGIHAVYQIIGRLKNIGLKKLEEANKIRLPKDNVIIIALKRLITFALVCFAWIFFRSNSLGDCGILIAKLFTDWSGSSVALKALGMTALDVIKIGLMFGILAVAQSIIKYQKTEAPVFIGNDCAAKNVTYVLFVLAIALAWIGLVAVGGDSAFIYFQF